MATPVKVVLMAGGSGTRFWPRSSPELPKQFLDLDGTGSLLRKTYDRALSLVESSHIYVSTQRDFAELVMGYLPELPERNLIVEPEARDTAPALGLSAVFVGQDSPDTVMVALPSDHLIEEEDSFARTLQAAIEAARSHQALITVGVRPDRPETGYGYMQLGMQVAAYGSMPLYHVAQFKEKPTEQVAQEYLKASNYLWNSGIFVWRVGVFRAALAKYLPDLEGVLRQIDGATAAVFSSPWLQRVFSEAPRISIDYGLLEKSSEVYAVVAEFPWDDLGTWSALARLSLHDEHGNATQGPVVLSGAKNVYVEARERTIAAVGVSDLIIVDSDNGLLVCSQEGAQDVKSVAAAVQELNRQQPAGLPASLSQNAEHREWGQELPWVNTPAYSGKFLRITAGKRLYCQGRYGYCSWFVQSGQGQLRLGEEVRSVSAGDVITIPPSVAFEMTALASLSILEVSSFPSASQTE